MASVKFEKTSREFQFFQDVWGLCQKHWNPEEKPEFWSDLVDDCDKFSRKYCDDDFYDFAMGVAQLYAGFIARKFKRMKK